MPKIAPSPSDRRDPNAKSFYWKEGIGKEATYSVLQIENGVLFAVYDIRSASEKDELLQAVKVSHPLKAWPNVVMLYVDDLEKLVYCPALHRLELHHGDKTPAIIHYPKTSGEIYQSLQKVLTKKAERSVGTVSPMTAAAAPLGLLVISVTIGVILYFAVENNDVKTWTPIVLGVLSTALIGWAAACMMSPHKTEIITISSEVK